MSVRIEIAGTKALEANRDGLAALLCACVAEGASIGWVGKLSPESSARFWNEVIRRTDAGLRVVLVAWVEGRVVGSVQLNIDTPENGSHRAEVCKLLVHPEVRRRGIARELMLRLEEVALERGRTLLVLDTGHGNPAEQLYRSLGYSVTGVVPRYAKSSAGPLESTTFMWKEVGK